MTMKFKRISTISSDEMATKNIAVVVTMPWITFKKDTNRMPHTESLFFALDDLGK